MKLTEHVKLRFVQRVIGIEEEEEAKKYLQEHEAFVLNKLLHITEHATLVYKGFVKDRKENNPSDMYIFQDLLLIASHESKKLITLWNIEESVPEAGDFIKKMRRNNGFINELRQKKSKQEEETIKLNGIQTWIEHNQSTIKGIWLKHHQETTAKQIEASVRCCQTYIREIRKIQEENRDYMRQIMYSMPVESEKTIMH